MYNPESREGSALQRWLCTKIEKAIQARKGKPKEYVMIGGVKAEVIEGTPEDPKMNDWIKIWRHWKLRDLWAIRNDISQYPGGKLAGNERALQLLMRMIHAQEEQFDLAEIQECFEFLLKNADELELDEHTLRRSRFCVQRDV